MSRALRPLFCFVLFAAVARPAAAQTFTLLHVFRHPDVSRVVFSPDGQTLATGGGDWATPDCVRLWDVATGKLRHTLRDPRDDWNVASISFAPDGRTVAYACDDKVRLWDVGTGRLLRVFSGGLVGDIEISPHGRLLVSGSGMDEAGDYSDVQVWDLRSGHRRILPYSKGVSSVAFSPDGQRLIGTNDEDNGASLPFERTWDAGTGKILTTRRLPRKTLGLAFSPDGALFVTGVWDAPAREPLAVWDARTGKRLCLLSGPHHEVRDADFSPTRPWLATGGGDEEGRASGELLLWDRRTGKPLTAGPSLSSPVASVAFAPNGGLLASADADGTVRVWRVH